MTYDDAGASADQSADAQPVALSDELATVFARMSGVLLSRETVDTVLGLITTLALETVPGAAGAGVTLVSPKGHRTTAAATDRLVEQADALQYELNEGPCLAAAASRSVVRVDDMGSESRWPRWTAGAVALGWQAALSAPMAVADTSLGAIKVYATQAGVFSEHSERLLGLFADQAAILLANMQSHESAQRMSDNLRSALRRRDVIGQAKGIIMASRHTDEDTAFGLLADASQAENKKLHEVAEALVQAANRRRR